MQPNAGVCRLTTAGGITYFTVPPETAGVPVELLGITVGHVQNLWVAGFAVNSIWRVTPTGTITAFPGISAQDIAAGPDGNLWLAPAGGSSLTALRPERRRSMNLDDEHGCHEPSGDRRKTRSPSSSDRLTVSPRGPVPARLKTVLPAAGSGRSTLSGEIQGEQDRTRCYFGAGSRPRSDSRSGRCLTPWPTRPGL